MNGMNEEFGQFRQVFGFFRFKLHRYLVDGTIQPVWFKQVLLDMGFLEFIYYAFVAKTVISAMTPQQTNNTAQYDAEAAEAKRNAERRELKNKRNRAGLNQTVGAGLRIVCLLRGHCTNYRLGHKSIINKFKKTHILITCFL
jgi:hypothetical protein